MKKSIARNISFTLLGYTLLVLVLLWSLQIFFINSYYQSMQRASVVRAGRELAALVTQEDYTSRIEEIAFSHRMSAIIIDEAGNQVYSVDMMGRSGLFGSRQFPWVAALLEDIISGEKTELIQTVRNERFPGESIVFARSVPLPQGGRRIVAITALLEPVNSTVNILKSQLGIITVVLLLVSVLLSWVVAQRLIRPVNGLTEKAKRLAKGNYTADYSGGGIEELDRLAGTLNFAATGLSKVEELRRELMANVSHDLKTPLTMIKAYAEMIRDLTGDDKERRDEQLEVIISETDRLSGLVNDLIRVSREEDAAANPPETFDLGGLLQSVVGHFAPVCPDYHIDLACPKPCMAFADKSAIGQVAYNLISNAINYAGEDRIVSILVAAQPSGWRVEVRDTGNGIPPEELPLIWERYYRSKNTHQRPVAGSGLGLSIVRGALERQNLPFGVDSTVGKGSCFWFTVAIAASGIEGPPSSLDKEA